MAISGLEDFKKLEIERDNLEVEISGLYEYLTQDGMPGVSGSLVDAEGFPRADLDLYAIRKARHRLACAQTDHKEVMKSIEAALVAIHAGSRVSVPRAQPAAPARAAVDEDGAVAAPVSMPPVPWAVIDEIAEGSPAQEAGLELGDLLCRFGDIDRHDTGDVSACKAAIAQLVPRSVGQPLDVMVLRGNPPMRVELTLTPKRWRGNGLLGCHLTMKTD
mmetsp:Transcript_10439/g.29724  ORF Transcript_10439/g.29724 Transcript_10439/m.29724 type:complete len:218 (+) Transcript_10439:120-773(+)